MPNQLGGRLTANIPRPCFQKKPRPDSNIMIKIVAKATMASFDQAEAVFVRGWVDVARNVNMIYIGTLRYNIRYRGTLPTIGRHLSLFQRSKGSDNFLIWDRGAIQVVGI
jgi:hypothetical protein